MKISIITPTYNDASSIINTGKSIFKSAYKNIEWIIVDDGSTDNTKEVITKFIKENKYDISYIYQENKDQLNAIINGLNHITGDLIYILHSDDLVPSIDFFDKVVNEFKLDKKLDSIIGDLVIINEKDEITGLWPAMNFSRHENSPAKLILNKGANIYGDVGVHKKEFYLNQIKNNYLTWNTPFWINMDNPYILPNIKKVNYPALKYRIHDSNYISNDIGKFCALNGEIRTLISLLGKYHIKNFNFQKTIFRLLRQRGIRKLNLSGKIKINAIKEKTPKEKVYGILKELISEKEDKLYLSMLSFYKNHDSKETIKIDKIEDTIYEGKDIRIFAKKYFASKTDKIYDIILSRMENGFNIVEVTNKEDYEKINKILKFLCIHPYVEVKIKKEGKI